MKTTYSLTVNRRVYISQDLTEMTGFAIHMGVLGCVEIGKSAGFDFSGIMCIRPCIRP